ncbi:hypothetical protein EDC04DRAFT_2603147 [Pisolithus marmoratus]|nr:hypothetical protein EDC04DRAFT_2603147 [Pisolithus marmoratus]
MPVAKSQPVPALHDNSPHLLPILSSQLEMVLLPAGRVRVGMSESMTLTELDVLLHTNVEARAKTPRMATPRVTTPRAITPRAKMPSVTTPRAQTFRGQTPAPAGKQKLVTIKNLPSDSEHLESSPALSESSLSSLESEPGADNKIPKLSGEVGRPGRGGYNLEEQLGWGEDGFKCLKKSVNKAIKNHLDTTKCRSQQNRKALITVCDLATAKFPDLDGFANRWPIFDLIQMRLKYLSSRAWQKRKMSAESSSNAAKSEKRRARSPKLKSPGPSKK